MTEVERYTVKLGYEWAFIYVDETNGVFTCYSSFGNYCYRWTHIGTTTLKEFLLDLDFDYFMGKTRPGYLRYSQEATLTSVRSDIISCRRSLDLTKDEARAAWNSMDDVHMTSGNDVTAFYYEFQKSEALMKVYDNDLWDVAKDRPDRTAVGFWEKIWPEFLKQISPDLQVVASTSIDKVP